MGIFVPESSVRRAIIAAERFPELKRLTAACVSATVGAFTIQPMKTPQAEEIPLPPHKPRTDAQSFSLAETEKYNYVHQHTRGHGLMQDCSIIEQYADGYCLVIAGHNRNVVAWSGCLTRERELNHSEKKTLAEAKAKR